MKTPRKKQVSWWLLLYLSIFLVGCAGGGATSYTGRLAKPESRIMLAAGDVHELQWQTSDIVIEATYALSPNELDLAGLVQLRSKLTHYPIVEYLRIEAHALDGEGIILGSYPLWRAGANAEPFFINWAFQRRFPVPEGTRAITFSYRGRMRDGGGWGPVRNRDDGGISWDFWYTP